MRPQIAWINGTLTGRTARKVIGRCALAAIGAGFFVISTGTFGADPATGYSTAIAVPSQALPASRRPMPARPVVPHDAKPDLSAQRARIVDQLYEQIMRRSSPECASTTNTAAMAGAC
jgi:hypothetical protein